ncbi:DUF427 domain-containing protein [Caulobacter sp. KR2-114]|uniref:DUF427 domain-containing protein n=1 Tax=Caulobacter sp. KR2-114 TaxID=3400912 RepID=UPI003C0CC07B
MGEMKLPGPDHPITVTAHPGRVQVLFEGHVIADSANVLTLKESTYKPVFYFPRDDVAMDYLHRTNHATHCPYKGDASYFTLDMDGDIRENAVWTYEKPYDAMSVITDRVAFYPNIVSFQEVAGGDTDVDAVVQHTDSGSGASQKDRWAPNVSEPGAA